MICQDMFRLCCVLCAVRGGSPETFRSALLRIVRIVYNGGAWLEYEGMANVVEFSTRVVSIWAG